MAEKKPGKIQTGRAALAGGAALVLLVVAIYLIYRYEPAVALGEYLASRINPVIFLALMLVLPVVGIPITIFLVLVGIKFGIVQGLLLSAAIMPCHMALTYYLVHSFLRKWISALLKPYNVSIPKLKGRENRLRALIFMLIPGLPYAVKNNLLALAEVGFVPYMIINWLAQFGLSIPFIILGGAVMEMDRKILTAAVALLLAGYLSQAYLRKKYGNPV
ncbi:MAG: hypothetical protein P1P81_09160 [Desulfobulbales bacterium]|nr:hypothetical protein [Desulfobulbales bacterium]